MIETNEVIKIHRGLAGVNFGRSPSAFIDGMAAEYAKDVRKPMVAFIAAGAAPPGKKTQ